MYLQSRAKSDDGFLFQSTATEEQLTHVYCVILPHVYLDTQVVQDVVFVNLCKNGQFCFQ